MIKRWIPSPPLSLALFIVWLLLNQSFDVATFALAAIFSIVVPLITKSLRPATVRMRRPMLVLKLTGVIMYDLVRSAWTVARLLLTKRNADIKPCFIEMPLQLRDPNALAVLAMIFCLTPGTAWGELSFDRSKLLIHMFDLEDPQPFIKMVRDRYERPLQEIFES